ncbi:phosphopantetheine-binding protein [Pendulispora rubella]|uniref:Phosphopantetheine-binding protein n=1 Tax=Pendulispora rubella TaxID=2741070 RepID=A0ABZ2LEL9_9BACT
MTSEDSNKTIRNYLTKFFPGHELSDEDDIFSLGFVNSMFAIQLVNFVEHQFGLEIENEDMELDNFRSVRALVELVRRKTQKS